MRLEIQKWGNGAAIRLNKALLKQVSGEIGSAVEVEVKNGGLFIKPVKNTFNLEDLLETCTKEKVRLDEEDKKWLHDEPKGSEIL